MPANFLKALFSAWLIALSTKAQETRIPLLTINGQSFTNALIRPFNATYGAVHHEGGLEKIKLIDLPQPFKDQFYNPENEKAELAAAIAKKEKAKLVAEATRWRLIEDQKSSNFRIVDGKEVNTADWTWIDGEVQEVLPDGIIVLLYEVKNVYIPPRPRVASGLARYGNFLGGERDTFTPTGTFKEERTLSDVKIFIKTDPRAWTTGENIKTSALYTGNKQFGPLSYKAYERGTPYPTKPWPGPKSTNSPGTQ